MSSYFLFRPVKRFQYPAPATVITTEDDLPQKQKMLVFLPHSDDGRYFGCSLYLMNKSNDIRIVILSPGNHGVDSDVSEEEKIRMRWSEAVTWAKMLGFKENQLVNFRADATYNSRRISPEDQSKLDDFVEKEKPTMVFVPSISDTAQAMNYHTRKMVIQSLLNWLEHCYRKFPKEKRSVFVVEYPTNHVPFLPPSDKNYIVFFTDPMLANVKHEANKMHLSQASSCFDFNARVVEAMHAVSEADTLHQMNKKRRFAESVSGVEVDPHTSRGEHFGVTKLLVNEKTKMIVEERLVFPLADDDLLKWKGEN